jgi:hypothetical protein
VGHGSDPPLGVSHAGSTRIPLGTVVVGTPVVHYPRKKKTKIQKKLVNSKEGEKKLPSHASCSGVLMTRNPTTHLEHLLLVAEPHVSFTAQLGMVVQAGRR